MRPLFARQLSPSEDGLLAALLAALALLTLVVGPGERITSQAEFRESDALGVLLVLAQTLSVAWRRRRAWGRPLAWPVFLFIHSAAVVNSVLDYTPTLAPVGVLLTFSTVVVDGGARHAIAASAVVGTGLVVVVAVTPEQLPAGAPVALVVLYAFLLVLSLTLRELRAHADLVEERAWWLERDREHQAERAAVAERHRIARDLHDAVAHHLSMIVIQARAGGHAQHGRPDPALARLHAIEGAGRQALDELRRLLGLLQPQAAAPGEPDLHQLPGLVERVGASGLPTRLHVEGDTRALPPEVAASTFRIVQESLTNALRHAGPARAEVLVQIGRRDVEITVTDDGSPGTPHVGGAGRGIAGMRERVDGLGGRLHAGPGPDGGFRIHASLPLPGDGA